MTTNTKPLLMAAKGQKPARTPLWLMRQAGRYLPEYRAIRAQSDTLTMFKTPAVAEEITLQPLKRFPLDGAIVYADILLLPDALGLGLEFVTGEGPRFKSPVVDEASLAPVRKKAQNPKAVIESLGYVGETLSRVKAKLSPSTTLIGFAGAPWTVASYMIEGQSTKGEFSECKKLMFTQPKVVHELLDIITTLTIEYLYMQVDAGAEILQLFESWSGALSPSQYAEFAQPYSARILAALNKWVPAIHFLGEGAGLSHLTSNMDMSVLGVDWRQDLSRVSEQLKGKSVALQGNLDPLLLFAPQDILKREALKVLEAGTKHNSGFIFNLGHGIKPTTPLENVGFLVDVVHNFRPS